MSFAALAALKAIDAMIATRREQGFHDLDQFDGQPPDEIGCSGLLVLYVLAEYAGADGYAFPSQKTLARRCRLHDRTVRGILAALERWGLIERQGRVRRDGTWTSDRIRLAFYEPEQAPDPDGNPAGLRPAGGSPRRLGSRKAHDTVRASDPLDQRALDAAPAGVTPDPTTFEPATEEVTSGTRRRDVEDAFAKWWAVYPRKAERAAALKLFERVVRKRQATPEQLIAGAQQYAIAVRQRDLAMVKLPTTWLQRECWAEEVEHAAAGTSKAAQPLFFASVEFAGPPELRKAIAALRGNAWAASWVDPCGWDAERSALVATTGFAADRIRNEIGKHLRDWGVAIVEPKSTR